MNEIIYGLYLGGECVYVGRTVRLRERTGAHRRRGIKFDRCETLATTPVGEGAKVETSFIQTLRPSQNKTTSGSGMVSRLMGDDRSCVSVRIPDWLSKKLKKAIRRSGISESLIIRASLSDLLNNRTPDAIIEAVIRHRQQTAKAA